MGLDNLNKAENLNCIGENYPSFVTWFLTIFDKYELINIIWIMCVMCPLSENVTTLKKYNYKKNNF